VANTPIFVLFGKSHLLTLALIVAVCISMGLVARSEKVTRLAWLLAVLLMAQEAVKLYVFIGFYGQDWKHSMPLDLCRMNEFVCAFMLVRRSYPAFQVAYFWALGGSVSALLTPDLAYGFPDPRFLLFFFGHGLAVVAVFYAVFGYGFWPRLRSVGITLLVSSAYAVIVAGMNQLLDTNFLFLRAKPESASVLDLLGPWPIYLFGLFGLAIVICLLCYAPFALARRWRARLAR
jgi:hypothetical integral membrane protein (TIGR02206 family)